MNEKRSEQMAFLSQLDDNPQISRDPGLNDCFADSDEEFAIDDFRNRIRSIQNRLCYEEADEESLRGIQRNLEVSQREESAWKAMGLKEGSESRVELERTFNSSCSSEYLMETLCESDDEQLKKLSEHGQSLDTFVLRNCLKSDAILSSEKIRRQTGDRGNIRRPGGDHTLDFEIHPDQMEIGGSEARLRVSEYYPRPPLSGSEECGDRGDLEEESMSLFYEFQDLPQVDGDTFEANDEEQTEDHSGGTSTKTKFFAAEKTSNVFTGQMEEPMPRISGGRKRGAIEPLWGTDRIFDRHFPVDPRHDLSLTPRSTEYYRQLQSFRTTEKRPGMTDIALESVYRSSSPGYGSSSGKRPRYAVDMTSFLTSEDSKWSDSSAIPTTCIDTCYDPIQCSKFFGDGERRGHQHTVSLSDWPLTEPVHGAGGADGLVGRGGVKSDEVFRLLSVATGGSNNHSTTKTVTSADDLWSSSSLISPLQTTQGFQFASDIELCQLVSPSAVFPPTDPAAVAAAASATTTGVDAATCLSLDSFITSFIDSEADENGASECIAQSGTGVSGQPPVNPTGRSEGSEMQNYGIHVFSPTPGGQPEASGRMREIILSTNATNGREIDGKRAALLKPLETNSLPRFEPVSANHTPLTFQAERATPGRNWQNLYSHQHHHQQQQYLNDDVTLPASHLPSSASHHSSQTLPAPHPSSANPGVSLPNLFHDLPFPLPDVPTGYKLVITHQSLASNGNDKNISPKETRIIIINPATQDLNCSYDQAGISVEAPSRNVPPQNPEVRFPQTISYPPQNSAHSGPGRPRDFDLPRKSSLSNTLKQCFHLTKEDTNESSSSVTPALDLSLSSMLPKFENFQSKYAISASHQNSQTIPTNPSGKPKIAPGSNWDPLKVFETTTQFPVNGTLTRISDDFSKIYGSMVCQKSPTESSQSGSQASTPTSDCVRQRSLHSTSIDSPNSSTIDVTSRVGLIDGIFPPNVVVSSPQCSGHLTPTASANSPQLPCLAGSRDPPSSAGLSASPKSVEPDSTVQPGHTEPTRDIIKALSDKLRRNRTQRLNSDSLVSTTYSPDRPRTPVSKSTDRQSPDSEPHPRQSVKSKSTDCAPPQSSPSVHVNRQNQLNRKPTTPSADKTSSMDDRSAFDVQVKAEKSPEKEEEKSQIHGESELSPSPPETQQNPKDIESCTEQKKEPCDDIHLTMDSTNQPDTHSDFEASPDFFFHLDAPISTVQRQDEDKITYLNKGQYYRLSLECHTDAYKAENVILRSVVMVLFRDSRAVGDELEAWKIWHSRQQSYKQRILDIDYKDACGVSLNCMNELAYNATALTWSPADQPVKVNVAVNCLSTDFSNQKGVKGIPLHIQIDTYDVAFPETPISKAYCKIKVFCDKGAERKVRDEERKRERRNKTMTETEESQEDCSSSLRQSNFYTVEDQTKDPILFTPSNDLVQIKINEKKSLPTPPTYGYSRNSGECDDSNTPKRSRPTSIVVSREYQRVLLYVREVQEEVFTALLLPTPTLSALAEAIHEKCSIEANKIKNIYKKSKKGILVKMDEKILRHYSNESTFIITTVTHMENPDSVMYDVILAEIDVD